MFGHPGLKLMFMGCGVSARNAGGITTIRWTGGGQQNQPKHLPTSRTWFNDLNHLYRPSARYEMDCQPGEFEWVITHDSGGNVFAWIRKGLDAHARCLVVVNFSPNVYYNYRVRVPFAGRWKEVFNSDSAHYGGSNIGNIGEVHTRGRHS